MEMGPLAEATSRLRRGRVQSEKPTAGLLSGSHFHIAGVVWGPGCACAGEGVLQCTIVCVREKQRGCICFF